MTYEEEMARIRELLTIRDTCREVAQRASNLAEKEIKRVKEKYPVQSTNWR